MLDGLCFIDIALFVQQFKAQLQKAPSQTGAVRLSQIQLYSAHRTHPQLPIFKSPFSILHF